jgi:hypothetical protein
MGIWELIQVTRVDPSWMRLAFFIRDLDRPLTPVPEDSQMAVNLEAGP